MLLFVWLVVLLWTAGATTLSTNFRLGVTTDSTSNNIVNMAHPTPLVVLSLNAAINLFGIDNTGVVDGEVVTVIRTGSTGNFVITHDSAGVTVGMRIILGNEDVTGTTWTIAGPGGVKFVYYSPYWYTLGYTRA